jgi:predicted RNA-binding protein with PUA-like domain
MAKARWLVKSEPETYAYADLERDRRTAWDGVRNNAAALHLRAMALGDEVLFYHSGGGKAVVGVAQVARTAYPDPTDQTGRFVAVDLAAVRALQAPVPLAALKAEPALADMVMLRQGRLSVSPVSDIEWAAVMRLAGE